MQVNELGKIGVIKDLQPWQIPANAWTAFTNIRCKDGQIRSFEGYDDLATPTVVPYFLHPVATKTAFHWVYCGDEKIYTYNGTAHTDITRTSGDYTGGPTDQWGGCTIYGIPVFNNGVDDPQMWDPPEPGTVLTKLTGWDSTIKAKVIRSFKDALFAFYTTESSVEYPHRVRFSATGGGGLPTDWDNTSTNDAGKTDLADTEGFLVDALPMGDTLMIYKEDSVYGCQYIGGQFVYRFYRIPHLPGALAQDCVTSFPGGHFVVGSNDVYIHDGNKPVSVIDDRNRDFLFDAIDDDSYTATYVALNQSKSEIWICYPESGEVFPNKALVWNYVDNTWGERDLPTGTTFIAPGPLITATNDGWDFEPSSTWDAETDLWGARSYSQVSKTLVGVTTGTKMYRFDNGNQSDGVNTSCIAERTGLNIGDNSDLYTVTRLYINAEGDPFNVYVGSQMFPNDTVTYEGPYEYDPSTDRKVDVRVTGMIHSVKFQSEADVSWGIDTYGYEARYAGKR